ncbi:type VII secretion protein EccE [Cryptosporangium aurantiacum]|uniref:Type VII secretion protein EccE n=1 Tax=Cryptosporangium aurantiacum TaxID=134849 RepID=A0A1M7TXK6_9ACTN|nr:type VII secretion protein EccE [Cryptosporangium aurantiacum]SHN75472.1 type VII secretion protein EccE [Cryptosporangium aurantiacum]
MATIDSPRVRAVARVGAQLPTDQEPATLRRRRRPGHLGPVNVLQIVCLELALVLAVVGWNATGWVRPALWGVAVVLPVVVFARFRGRWAAERLVLRSRYRRRRASARLLADDRRLTTLRDLAPELTVETVEGVGGTRLGVGRDGAGWFAVVAVQPTPGLRGEAQALPPLDQLARSLADAEQPGSVVQLVVHTVPGDDTARTDPAAESYRELLRPLGGGTDVTVAPVSVGDQLCWVTVRIEAKAVAEVAVAEPEAISEVPTVLGALVRRIGNVLKRSGFAHQVLDGDGLLDALVHSLAVEVSPAGTERRSAVESWGGWRAAGFDHQCFWIRSWPSLDRCGPLLAALYRSPAALTSISLAMTPGSGGAELRCLVRVVDAPETIGRTVALLRTTARNHGAHLFPLDGEQAPAVYATAPTGVGVL